MQECEPEPEKNVSPIRPLGALFAHPGKAFFCAGEMVSTLKVNTAKIGVFGEITL